MIALRVKVSEREPDTRRGADRSMLGNADWLPSDLGGGPRHFVCSIATAAVPEPRRGVAFGVQC